MARLAPFVVLGFFGAVCHCLAQATPVVSDTVVVTATGEEQPLASTAAAVWVISGTELKAIGAASVSEGLRWVSGATLLRSGLDNGATSLFLRGTGSNQTLVMFDGVRLTSPYFGGYDWSLPLGLGIDRVEVVRGPYSALYGGDAVGGVVQLVPSTAAGTELRAFAEGGSSSWRRAEVEASAALGRWTVLAVAGSRDGSGPLENDDFSTKVGTVDIGESLGDGQRIGLLVRRTTSSTGVPFSGAVITPHRSTAAAETLLAVPVRLQFGKDLRLEAAVSTVRRALQFRDPDDPSGFLRSDTAADSDGASLVLHARVASHQLAVGGEWRRDSVRDGSSFGTNLDDRRQVTRSLFVQDQVDLGHSLTLLAGARWDGAGSWGSELSPRVTLSFEGGGSREWVAVGKAFRAPSLGELYYPFSGNAQLRPEHSESIEVGWARPIAGGRAALQLVGFANRQDNLIDFDFASYRFANIAAARQRGIEASCLAMVASRGRATVSLSWLTAEDATGQPLVRRPTWSGSVTLMAPLAGRLEGAFTIAWIGPRSDLDPITLARVRQGGFVMANAAASLPVGRGLAARVRVENLANRSYEEVRGYPAPARRLLAGLEVVLR